MRRIAIVLSLTLLALADDTPGPDTVVRRVHDLTHLKDDPVLLAIAVDRMRDVARLAEFRVEGAGIEVCGPVWTQRRIERVLREVRQESAKVITFEVHFVEIKGDVRVSTVLAEKLDAFLKERHAERIASHTFACRNFRKATVELTREVPFLPDFDAELSGATVTAVYPGVAVASERWTATFDPVVVGRDVRIAAEFSVAEVSLKEFDPSFAPDVGLKVSMPQTSDRTTHQPLLCAPDAFAVVWVKEPLFALVRATVKEAAGASGSERR
jgi:hypothetical protein